MHTCWTVKGAMYLVPMILCIWRNNSCIQKLLIKRTVQLINFQTGDHVLTDKISLSDQPPGRRWHNSSTGKVPYPSWYRSFNHCLVHWIKTIYAYSFSVDSIAIFTCLSCYLILLSFNTTIKFKFIQIFNIHYIRLKYKKEKKNYLN